MVAPEEREAPGRTVVAEWQRDGERGVGDSASHRRESHTRARRTAL